MFHIVQITYFIINFLVLKSSGPKNTILSRVFVGRQFYTRQYTLKSVEIKCAWITVRGFFAVQQPFLVLVEVGISPSTRAREERMCQYLTRSVERISVAMITPASKKIFLWNLINGSLFFYLYESNYFPKKKTIGMICINLTEKIDSPSN